MQTKSWVGAVWGISLLLLASSAHADKDSLPLNKSTISTKETNDPKTLPGMEKPSDGLSAPERISKKPYVASLDTYGSKRINETALRQLLGKDLDQWIQKGLAHDPKSPELEAKLKQKIKEKWGFPIVEWSIVQYFEPGNPAIHITLDVVEKEDMERRVPFLRNPPTETFTDPDGLILHWLEYEDTALGLVERGELEPVPNSCPAFHCPFGHKHPSLAKYEKIFVEGVKKHEAELVKIQQRDVRPDFRGSATYLLAYAKDGKKVVGYMVDRIKDGHELVRNNALRVLGDIAEFHPEFPIPLKPILEALDYPRVSDRSKAVYVAFHMASNSRQARDEIMESGIDPLIRIMESMQPDHKEFAHGILRKVSGKDFAASDMRAWRGWYSKIQSDRAIANKK